MQRCLWLHIENVKNVIHQILLFLTDHIITMESICFRRAVVLSVAGVTNFQHPQKWLLEIFIAV